MSLTENDHAAFAAAIELGDAMQVGVMLQQFPELANHPDWTPPPLHCAVLWNQPKIAELLLRRGADMEMLDPDRQTTPLRYAIMYCKCDLIPLLLSHAAVAGPIAEDGVSALQLARDGAAGAYEEYGDLPRREAYQDVVALLLESGINE